MIKVKAEVPVSAMELPFYSCLQDFYVYTYMAVLHLHLTVHNAQVPSPFQGFNRPTP